ncbi:hypothetical protein ACOTE7_22830 [Achromobacter xylosoxidans]
MARKLQTPGWSAAGEVVFTLVVSNLSLGIMLFIAFLIDRDAEISMCGIWERLASSINPTEVLIYILAVITPTLWYMAVNVRARKYLKGFTWILFLQCALILGSAIVFALAKTGMTLNQRVLIPFAWGSFLFAIAIWYGVLVFQKSVKEGPHVDASDIAARGGKAMAQELDS